MKRLIANSIFGIGLLALSTASVLAVKEMSWPVIVAVVGANLLVWGFMLINSDFGADEEEETQ
jgi:hypothetical protein